METRIRIEQFDNGITLCWHGVDISLDDKKKVIYNSDIDRELGKAIYSDVKAVMDAFVANEVELSITIKPIGDYLNDEQGSR